MRTKLLTEQHFHGAFGVDFNRASVEDVLYLSKEILKYGIGGIFPTIVTDTPENTKRAISVIKEAAKRQSDDSAKILGVHLEGIFLNPEKKGIHDEKLFLPLTAENFRKIEDDFIKIVTLAPELDEDLIDCLISKGIKVQAGHCLGADLKTVQGLRIFSMRCPELLTEELQLPYQQLLMTIFIPKLLLTAFMFPMKL